MSGELDREGEKVVSNFFCGILLSRFVCSLSAVIPKVADGTGVGDEIAFREPPRGNLFLKNQRICIAH